MDYRKNMNTPRDMIDPELLLRLMRENEPVTATFGGCGSSCASRMTENRRKGNCGCGNPGTPGMSGNTSRQENPDHRPCGESCANDDRMKNFPIAMAYVPMQEWEGIADDETALARGTLFDALHLPWYASACDKKCGKCGDKR